jgi:hypothetical protein
MIILKDKLVIGAVAGFIADVILDLTQLILIKCDLLKYSLEHFAASMFIRVNNPVLITGFQGMSIGLLASMALAILLGIAFVYFIDWSGYRFIKCKGVLYGLVVWFIIYGGIRAGLHISFLQDYNPTHTLIQLFTHLLFGYMLGLIIAKLRTSPVFPG